MCECADDGLAPEAHDHAPASSSDAATPQEVPGSAAGATGAKARALALLRAQAAEPAQQQDAHTALTTSAAPAVDDWPHQHVAMAADMAGLSAEPHGNSALDPHGDGDTAAHDEWADDVGPADDDRFPFANGASSYYDEEADADQVQDKDHMLPADQTGWEHTSAGESLPPGWAKCPDMGKEVFGLTPIKVRTAMPGGKCTS